MVNCPDDRPLTTHKRMPYLTEPSAIAISVIVPAWNEAENLPALLGEIEAAYNAAKSWLESQREALNP